MADFADFAVKVARYAGVEAKVREIFSKLTREQSAFTLESDTIFELLSEWAGANPDREVTNAELCSELQKLAERKSTDFEYEGKTRAFAQRMNALRSNLEEFFEVTKREGRSHTRLYSFTPKPRGG